jgi:Gas vesicle protein
MTEPGRLARRHGPAPANLADVLERVLDKGVVIAGDVKVNLLDVELLTIKLRLLVASVHTAKELGIDWWERDPTLSSRARRDDLADENRRLRERIVELEDAGAAPATLPDARGAADLDGGPWRPPATVGRRAGRR